MGSDTYITWRINFYDETTVGLFNKGSKMLEKRQILNLDDVVGLNTTKEEVVVWLILLDKKKYKNAGVQIPKGILLKDHGEQVKHTAKAIANRVDYKFYYMVVVILFKCLVLVMSVSKHFLMKQK